MASNLSSIGFAFRDEEEFGNVVSRLLGDAVQRLACAPGDYAIWRSTSGAELWLHLSGERDPAGELGACELVGLTPFYEGRGRVPVEVRRAVRRQGDNDFEGLLEAWVSSDPGDTEGGYPIVLDAVDFAAHEQRPMPFRSMARVAAFAHRLASYPDTEAHAQAQSVAGRPTFGPQSFVPFGMFSGVAGDADPSAAALINGIAVEHLTLTNEESGRTFSWLLLDCNDITFDVLADPEVVSGTIAVGAIVEVEAQLFARLID